MLGLAMGAVVGLVAAAAGGEGVKTFSDTSFLEPNGDHVLQQSIDIASSPSCPWRALTDADGIKTFGVKVAHVELKNGGVIEEGFSPSAEIGGKDTIRHRIIAYLPERLLVLRNEQTPPGLPHAELYRNVVQVIALEPRGKNRTRLTISHTGYGSGADYDELYTFFRTHNPEFLTGAKKACEASKP